MLRELCNLSAGTLTSHEKGLSVLGALRWLVPEGLHVMRRPLGLAKITRHVLLEVSGSLRNQEKRNKKLMNYTP